MRLILALTFILAGLTAIADTADARKKTQYAKPKSYASQGTSQSRGSSDECDRARLYDSAGSLRGYPCWAQLALSPKNFAR